MDNGGGGVFSRSVQSGKWVLISNVAQKFLSLITFFVLARLLKPADYGIIAVVFLITGFFVTITSLDFDKALMQKADSVDELACLDAVWTFNFFKLLFLSLIAFFGAPFFAGFFHIGQYVEIIRWGSVFIFIPALSNSRQYYFFKNIDFKKIFLRDNIAQVFYIIVTFLFVFFISKSAWALFAGHVARYLTGAVMTYILYPYKQVFSFQFSKLKRLFGYAKWVNGQNILDYLTGMIDSLYVGRILDSSRLGLYTKAKDISFMPVSPLFVIFDKIGFASYAKLQDKFSKIQEGFIKTFDVVTAITLPVFLVLLAEGGLIVQLLLGTKWLGIVVPLKILAATTVFSSLVAISRPIFDAVGRPDINFKSNILQLLSSIILIYFGAGYYGVNGVAFAMLLSWIIILIFVIFKARPILKLGWDKFHDSIISVIASVFFTILVCAPLLIYNKLVMFNTHFSLALIVFSGLLYALSLWLSSKFFSRGPWHTLLSILREIRR